MTPGRGHPRTGRLTPSIGPRGKSPVTVGTVPGESRSQLARRRSASHGLALALAIIAISVVGFISLFDVRIGAMVAVTLCLGALLTRWAILPWFLFGGILVLDSSDSLTTPKMVYFAGLALGTMAAQYRVWREWDQLNGGFARRALWGAYLIAAWVILFTLPYAVVRGTPLVSWGRDAFTQLLLTVGVVVGLDAAIGYSKRVLAGVGAFVGLVVAVQFAITWTSRRIAEGDAEVLLFGSRALLALPIAMGLVFGLARGPIRFGWLFLSYATLSAAFASGVRSSFLLLLSFLGVVGWRRAAKVRPLRLALFFVIGVACIWALLSASTGLFVSESFLRERWSSILRIVEAGDLAFDASGRARLDITRQALLLFKEHLLFGAGLGTIRVVDSPAVFLAKYGIVGATVMLSGLLLLALATTRRFCTGPMLSNTIAKACWLVWFASFLSAVPTEDKGLAMGVSLLVALVGAEYRQRQGSGASQGSCLNEASSGDVKGRSCGRRNTKELMG